ncbi:hypothetical protein AB0P20_36495, partial [Streptomyces nigra]
MTRPAQHTSASPQVASGSAGEETASTPTTAQPGPEAKSPQAPNEGGRVNSETPKASSEAEDTAAEGPGATAVSVAETTPGGRPESEAEPDSDSEAEPGAAAEAKSRLPALVRTMTAT